MTSFIFSLRENTHGGVKLQPKIYVISTSISDSKSTVETSFKKIQSFLKIVVFMNSVCQFLYLTIVKKSMLSNLLKVQSLSFNFTETILCKYLIFNNNQ